MASPPHPYHHPDNLDRTSWFENQGQGGGCSETLDLILESTYTSNTGAFGARDANDTARLR